MDSNFHREAKEEEEAKAKAEAEAKAQEEEEARAKAEAEAKAQEEAKGKAEAEATAKEKPTTVTCPQGHCLTRSTRSKTWYCDAGDCLSGGCWFDQGSESYR